MAIKILFVHSEWSLSLLNYTEPNRNIKQILFDPTVADCWTNIKKNSDKMESKQIVLWYTLVKITEWRQDTFAILYQIQEPKSIKIL